MRIVAVGLAHYSSTTTTEIPELNAEETEKLRANRRAWQTVFLPR